MAYRGETRPVSSSEFEHHRWCAQASIARHRLPMRRAPRRRLAASRPVLCWFARTGNCQPFRGGSTNATTFATYIEQSILARVVNCGQYTCIAHFCDITPVDLRQSEEMVHVQLKPSQPPINCLTYLLDNVAPPKPAIQGCCLASNQGADLEKIKTRINHTRRPIKPAASVSPYRNAITKAIERPLWRELNTELWLSRIEREADFQGFPHDSGHRELLV